MGLTQNISRIIAIFFSLTLILLPTVLTVTDYVSAQGDDDTVLDDTSTGDGVSPGDGGPTSGDTVGGTSGGTVGGTSGGTVGGTSGGSRGLTNPLKFDSLTGFLLAIVDIILILAVPIIILFIIYAGFLMVTAQGNESKLETAKSALLWAVVGGVIVLGARVILKIVEGTVEGFKV